MSFEKNDYFTKKKTHVNCREDSQRRKRIDGEKLGFGMVEERMTMVLISVIGTPS